MSHWPLVLVAAALPILSAPGCGPRPGGAQAAKAPAPAKVENPRPEQDLAAVVLTPEAENRLGVRTARVERRKLERSRTFGGEAVVPPGRAVEVSAPFAGVVQRPPRSAALEAGSAVRAGEPVFLVKSILTPEVRLRLEEARAEARGQVEGAKVRVEAAVLALARAGKLQQEKAGSERALEEARAESGLAEAALRAAEARAGLLDERQIEAREGSLLSLPVAAPHQGIIRDLKAAEGQLVAAGTPLFSVLDPERLWIRVPVYAGELPEIDPSAPARVARLPGASGSPARAGPPARAGLQDLSGSRVAADLSGGHAPSGTNGAEGLPTAGAGVDPAGAIHDSSSAAPAAPSERPARPVAAPPAADPAAATVDLVYEVENRDGGLRPGERVEATLRLKGEEESLVVPWAAVLHDVHGGTWVYVKTAPGRFERRRVEVRSVEGALAVLGRGLAAGAEVATDGAAEIFGTEFGVGK